MALVSPSNGWTLCLPLLFPSTRLEGANVTLRPYHDNGRTNKSTLALRLTTTYQGQRHLLNKTLEQVFQVQRQKKRKEKKVLG